MLCTVWLSIAQAPPAPPAPGAPPATPTFGLVYLGCHPDCSKWSTNDNPACAAEDHRDFPQTTLTGPVASLEACRAHCFDTYEYFAIQYDM